MCVYIYIYIYIYDTNNKIAISLSLYIYIYICICICRNAYILALPSSMSKPTVNYDVRMMCGIHAVKMSRGHTL